MLLKHIRNSHMFKIMTRLLSDLSDRTTPQPLQRFIFSFSSMFLGVKPSRLLWARSQARKRRDSRDRCHGIQMHLVIFLSPARLATRRLGTKKYRSHKRYNPLSPASCVFSFSFPLFFLAFADISPRR